MDVEVMVGKTVVYTGVNGEFEFAVRKKRAYAVAVEGRKGVSGSGDRTGRSGYGCCGAYVSFLAVNIILVAYKVGVTAR